MKNRSRRTPRREAKRIERKRARAADRDALRGARPRLVRFDSWSSRSHQPEALDEGMPRAGTKPSRRGQTNYWCPAREGRKRHHYLSELVSEPFLGTLYWVEHRLCAHCGREDRRVVKMERRRR